jgi:hypothetical protein
LYRATIVGKQPGGGEPLGPQPAVGGAGAGGGGGGLLQDLPEYSSQPGWYQVLPKSEPFKPITAILTCRDAFIRRLFFQRTLIKDNNKAVYLTIVDAAITGTNVVTFFF